MNQLRIRFLTALVALLVVGAAPLLAQSYPYPRSVADPPSVCTAATCPGENDSGELNAGLPTFPFDTPIAEHIGRVIDSANAVQTQCGCRTMRGETVRAVTFSRSNGAPPRVYMISGDLLMAWTLDSSLPTNIDSDLSSASVLKSRLSLATSPCNRGAYPETVQNSFEAFTFPTASAGWEVFFGDVNRGLLTDVDFDDRGYVYTAYSEGGWAITEDKPGSARMPLVAQVRGIGFSPKKIFSLRSGSKYYVGVQDDITPREIAWFDVTTPTTPKRLADRSAVIDFWAKDYEREKIAVVEGSGALKIYSWDDYATGGGAEKTYMPAAGKSFNGASFDDRGRLWVTEGTPGRVAENLLIQIKPDGASDWVKTEHSVYPSSVSPTNIAAWANHVAVQGRTSDGYDMFIFKTSGDVPELLEGNDFFNNYYHSAPRGYAQPGSDADKQRDVELVKAGTKVLLFYQAYGMSDVFQLGETGPSISATMKTDSFGTENPNSKQVEDGPFPGDPVTFRATASTGSFTVNWNFGNSDSPDDNTASSNTGSDVMHQYSGLSTLSKVTSKKTVTVTAAGDASLNDTVSVQLLAPTARIGLKSTGAVVSSSGFEVVAGDKFVDASDGSVESHYATWTVGPSGSPTKLRPSQEMAVGDLGNHSVILSVAYGKYDPVLFQSTNPYVLTTSTLTYEVLPFLATLKPLSKVGSTVTFDADAQYTTDTSILSASNWTVDWTLLSPAGATDASASSTVAISTNLPNFDVDQSLIKNGSTIRLRISVASGAPAGYSEYVVEKTLTLPDPKIVKKAGCTKVGIDCTLEVQSISGKSTSTWGLSWNVTRGATSVKTGSTNPITFKPTVADSYVATVTATEAAVLSAPATLPFTIEASACSAAPTAANLIIAYTGQTSGCTLSNGLSCQKGEVIKFDAKSFGYSFQECDEFDWDFGDGGSASTKTANHTYTGTKSSYSVKLTVSNDVGGANVSVSVPFSGGGEVCTAPSSITVSYTGSKGCSPSKSCEVGERITFTAKRGSSSLLSCDETAWSFSDGSTSTSKTPSKTFSATGAQSVSVTVSNPSGNSSASKSFTIVPSTGGGGGSCDVAPTPANLVISYTGPTSGCTKTNGVSCLPGEAVQFEAKSFGYDFDSCDHEFSWEFGDGGTSSDKDPVHNFTGASSLVPVTMTVSNDKGSAEVTLNVKVQGGVPVKPTPKLTYAGFPAKGTRGVPVTFTVNSDLALTTEWTWTFGDGSATDLSQFSVVSNSNTIQHTFASTGSFTVKVQAKNAEETLPGVTGSVSNKIKIEEPTEIRYLIPVASHISGVGGSVWRTDVQIYNPDPAVGPSNPLALKFSYNGVTYPKDGSSMGLTKSTTIIEDFLYKVLGDDCKNPTTGDIVCAGPVIVTTTAKNPPQIWTRTYNQTEAGTYGQLIPAIRLDQGGIAAAAVTPTHYHMPGLRADARFRTNIGFVNPNVSTIVAKISIWSEDGTTKLHQYEKALSPFTFTQETINPAAFTTPIPASGLFSVQVEAAGGEWLIAYASLIDSQTGDPVYFNAIKDTDLASTDYRTIILPGISHTGQWRSDTAIFNPDEAWMVLKVEYFDMTGTLVGTPAEGIILEPNEFIYWEDVLKQGVLGTIPDGAGSFRITVLTANTKGPIVNARTYYDGGATGTYGQGIGGFSAFRANVKPGKGAIVPGVRDDANYYTNMGLVNLSASPVTVAVSVLNPDTGAVGKIQNYPLAPNQMVIGRFLLDDAKALTNATLKVEASGDVWAFVSVIDNTGGAGTHDPEYIPATPMP